MAGSAALDDLPARALILLIGPSGAGKSTWASARFRPSQILESDRFRELVADDAADQRANADAFRVLHSVVRARCRRGLRTVVDATNLTLGARRALRLIAAQSALPVCAIVFDVSLERCLMQNTSRADRRVPDDVVRKHHAGMRAVRHALPSEGYEAILMLDERRLDEDAGALAIVPADMAT